MKFNSFFKKLLILAFIPHSNIFSEQKNIFEYVTNWVNLEKQKVSRIEFENGLTALHYPKFDSPKVHISMNLNVGSRNEKPHEAGFAHVLEHMVFKGTDEGENSLSESDINAIAEKYCVGQIGEGFNAFTHFDKTCYFFNTDKNNWPIFLQIFKGWLLHAKLDKEHLASEIKTIYEELKDRNGDCITNGLSLLVPPTHPYFNSVIGYKETLLNSDIEDLRKFYKEHYIPANAAIVAVGNISKEDFANEICRIFNTNIKTDNEQIAKQKTSKSLPLYKDLYQHHITLYTSDNSSSVQLIWPLPASNEFSYECAAVVSAILDERLTRKLKDELQYVFDIQTGFSSLDLHNLFYINFDPKRNDLFSNDDGNEKDIKHECKKIILQEIEKIKKEGFSEQELTKMKNGSTKNFISGFEYEQAIYQNLESLFAKNKMPKSAFSFVKKINQLTVSDLTNFVKQYLKPILVNAINAEPLPNEERESWVQRQEQSDEYDQKLLENYQRKTPIEKLSYVHRLPAPKLLDFNFEAPDKEIVLSNGIKVFLKKRTNIPFISLRMGELYNNNYSRYIRLNKKYVISELARNLLVCGSEDYTKQDHEDFANEYGIICYIPNRFLCFKTDFKIVAQRFMHIISHPTYPEQYFNEAITNWKEELKQAEDHPWSLAINALTKHLYKDYSWIIDDEKIKNELDGCTREDLFEYHKEFISPHNKFLVIVGDFDEDSIIDDIEEIFGTTTRSIHTEIEEVEVPKIENPVQETVTINIPQERVALLFGKLTVETYSKDWYCLVLLEKELNKKLFDIREQNGTFYSCKSSLTSSSTQNIKDLATVATQVSINNLEDAKNEIKNALSELMEKGIKEEDLIVSKQNFLMSLAKSFDTTKSICDAYTHLKETDKDWNYFQKLLETINAITVEDINAAAKKYLDPQSWTIIQVGRLGDK